MTSFENYYHIFAFSIIILAIKILKSYKINLKRFNKTYIIRWWLYEFWYADMEVLIYENTISERKKTISDNRDNFSYLAI